MIIFVLAAVTPAIGSAEFNERAQVMHRTEYPAVFRLVDAARKEDESAFRRNVASGATISIADQGSIPFTSSTIHDLASRCGAANRVGIRFLDDTDELSIYWQCPAGSPSPMTTLTFKNGKVIHAATGRAVVHTLPPPQKGLR